MKEENSSLLKASSHSRYFSSPHFEVIFVLEVSFNTYFLKTPADYVSEKSKRMPHAAVHSRVRKGDSEA